MDDLDADFLVLDVDGWSNADPVTEADLRGKVVVVEVFQMLCPGCVSRAIPQAQRVQRVFAQDDVAIIGLHSVFEHHEAMTPVALAAFLHEYRITFPVAIDRAEAGNRIPATMRRYDLQGTPTTLLVDRAGRIRHSLFGGVDDLTLGKMLGTLLAEAGMG